jgi:hypothetical protein
MNNIPYEERQKVYANALVAYGEEKQCVVAIEEMSDVAKELCKVLRGKGDMEHLAEEVADATIMLEQVRYFFGINELVCKKMDEKIMRLENNLK